MKHCHWLKGTNNSLVLCKVSTSTCLSLLLQMADKTKRGSKFSRLLRKRVPILSWMPSYSTDKGISDLIAGVTVGLTVMPQSLAYATLAGLEPQVAIFQSLLPLFMWEENVGIWNVAELNGLFGEGCNPQKSSFEKTQGNSISLKILHLVQKNPLMPYILSFLRPHPYEDGRWK